MKLHAIPPAMAAVAYLLLSAVMLKVLRRVIGLGRVVRVIDRLPAPEESRNRLLRSLQLSAVRVTLGEAVMIFACHVALCLAYAAELSFKLFAE